MRPTTHEDIKEAVADVRQFGEPIEIYWDGETDSPHDEALLGHGWMTDFGTLAELRKWIKKNPDDHRLVTIYCRGDFREVRL